MKYLAPIITIPLIILLAGCGGSETILSWGTNSQTEQLNIAQCSKDIGVSGQEGATRFDSVGLTDEGCILAVASGKVSKKGGQAQNANLSCSIPADQGIISLRPGPNGLDIEPIKKYCRKDPNN